MAIADILNLKLDNEGDIELETVKQTKTVFVPSVLTSLEQDVVLHLKLNEMEGNVGANLLGNPGFEAYAVSPGAPDAPWAKDANITAERETVIRRSGNNSLKLVATGSTAITDGVNQTINGLVAGKSHQVSGFMRTTGGINERARLVIVNTTDAVTVVDLRSPVGAAATVFRKASATFVPLAGKTYVIECRLENANLGSPPTGAVGYFDDLAVQQLEAKDSTLNAFHGIPTGASNTPGPTINARGPLEPASPLLGLFSRNMTEPNEVRMYSAAISGFNITVADPVAAGWTLVPAGTMTNLVQSATHLLVISNSQTRVALDKTTGTGVVSMRVAMWNGSAMVELLRNETSGSHDWQDLTVTRILTNAAGLGEVLFTSSNRGGGVTTSSLALMRDVPGFRVAVQVVSNGATAARSMIVSPNTTERTALLGISGANPVLRDSFGFVGGNNDVNCAYYWIPVTSIGIDLILSRSSDQGTELFSTTIPNFAIFISPDNAKNVGHLSGHPRTYGLGDANQFYGNNDGQMRDAEGHRVWEGETPLIGTELLTNGQFETDLSGWTQTGTWTRVTTQKKFGAACAEVTASGADKILERAVSGLTVGAVYAATGWIRMAGATGTGNARIEIDSSSIISNSMNVADGATQEWTYLRVVWTATATSHNVRLRVNNVVTAGTIQYDGISVIQVKDAAGLSTLAFDTRSTTGWTATDNSTLSVVDSPRGKAIRMAVTAVNKGGYLSYSVQDLSRFRRLGIWARKTVGTTVAINVAIRTTGVSSTGQTFATFTLSTDWQFFTFEPAQSASALTAAGAILVESAGGSSSTATFDVGPITLSEFDISIGQRHGLVDPMEDPSLALWFKMDESSGNLADSSGNGIVGTAAGTAATYSAATVRAGLGTCIDFGGVDTRFTLPSVASSGWTGCTVEAWVNPDTLPSGSGFVNILGDQSDVITLFYEGAGTRFRMKTNGNNNVNGPVYTTTAAWLHIIGVYDGVTLYLYQNGALVATATGLPTPGNIANNLTAAIGGDDVPTAAEFWDGKIDEVRLYSRALGPEEVAMRYNATAQRLARWVPSASLNLEQTTDKMDGSFAIKATPSVSSQTMTLSTRPMDLTAFTHFGIWTKQTVSDAVQFRIGSDSSNYHQYQLNGSTAYTYHLKDLGAPTSTVGSPNLARVTYIAAAGLDTPGGSFFFDSLKLMVGAETGDWRYAVDAAASSGYVLKTLTTPAVNNSPRVYTMNFPTAGQYFIGVMALATGAGGFMECYVDGVASGTPQAISTTGLATNQTQHVFGPFNIAAAGDKTVEVRVSTVGSMTALAVDFLGVYPYRSTADTPAALAYHFPQNLAEELTWIWETANNWGHFIGSRVDTGQVYQMDGVDDYITVPSDPLIRRSNDFSYELWMKPDYSTAAGFLLTFDNVGSDTTDSPELKLLTDGRIRLERNNASQEVNTTGRVPIGLWNHIVATFKDGVTTIYINGQPNVTSSNVTAFVIPNAPLLIGRRGSASDQNFDGSIYKVRLYDRAITAAEVLARYDATVNGAIPTADESAAGVYTQQTVEVVVGQQFKVIQGEKAIQQHIQARILSLLGERILHPTYGLNFPVIETVFDQNLVRGEMARTILDDPDVEDLPEFEVTFDGRTRRATYEGQAKLKDDSVIGIIGTSS